MMETLIMRLSSDFSKAMFYARRKLIIICKMLKETECEPIIFIFSHKLTLLKIQL